MCNIEFLNFPQLRNLFYFHPGKIIFLAHFINTSIKGVNFDPFCLTNNKICNLPTVVRALFEEVRFWVSPPPPAPA